MSQAFQSKILVTAAGFAPSAQTRLKRRHSTWV